MKAINATSPLSYMLAAFSGSVLATGIYLVLKLEFRYAAAAVCGIAMIAAGLYFFDRLQDYLLYLLIFNIQFVGFEKGLFFSPDVVVSTPAIGVGLADIVLVLVYLAWFYRVFVQRIEPLPKMVSTDYWVLAFFAAHLISWPGSASALFTFYEVVRVGKYILLYFYISRHLKREHLKPLLLLLFVNVAIQSSLGLMQSLGGKLVGFGTTKGAESWDVDFIDLVPGFSFSQGSGTLLTAHCLGVFLGMLLMITLALTLESKVRFSFRLLGAMVFALGCAGIVTTYARGAWLAFAVALLFMLIVYFPRDARAFLLILAIAVAGSTVLVANWRLIHARIFDAPPDIMEARWELNRLGWRLFKENPIVGVGANAYYQAHDQYDSRNVKSPFKAFPPHNLQLFIAAQMGTVGFVIFYGLMLSTIARCRILTRSKNTVMRALGWGIIGAILLEQVEGVTNFTFYTTTMYYWLWFLMGIAVALTFIVQKNPDEGFGIAVEGPTLQGALR